MQNLINQIKGVVGVTGVMIIDRISGSTSALLPARYEEDFGQGLKQHVLELLPATEVNSMLRIRLAQGWAIIKILPRSIIVVLANLDLNIPTFNLILKSVSAAIEKATESGDSASSSTAEKGSPESLVKAVNLTAEYFTESISRFQLAQILRESRNQLMGNFPGLKHFTVDHNGKVSLIKGSDMLLNDDVTEAVAAWIATLRNLVGMQTVVVGFNIKNITGEVGQELESLGFFRQFQKFAALIPQSQTK